MIQEQFWLLKSTLFSTLSLFNALLYLQIQRHFSSKYIYIFYYLPLCWNGNLLFFVVQGFYTQYNSKCMMSNSYSSITYQMTWCEICVIFWMNYASEVRNKHWYCYQGLNYLLDLTVFLLTYMYKHGLHWLVCVDEWRKYFGRKRAQLSLLMSRCLELQAEQTLTHTHMHSELAFTSFLFVPYLQYYITYVMRGLIAAHA